MLRKIFFSALMLLGATACGEDNNVEPVMSYQANFYPEKVACVESVAKSLANDWKLEVYEKDRKQMNLLTQGQDAFFIALYFQGDAILDISNVGMGSTLTMGVFDFGKLSLDKLHRLANEMIKGINQQCDIQLSRTGSN